MTLITVDTDHFRVDLAQWLAAICEKRAPRFGRGA